MELTTGILSHIELLPGLEKPWRKLQSRFDTPLLTFEWFTAAAESFSHPDDLEIHIVKEEGEVTAIAPLGKKTHLPVRSELLGSSVLREPGGFLYKSGSGLRALLESLLNTPHGYFFKGLPLDGHETLLLLDLVQKESRRVYQRTEKLPRIEFHGEWEDFSKQHISSSRRSSFRRLHKKAAQHQGHPLTIEILPATHENFDSLFLDFIEIEAGSWKGRTGTALLQHHTVHHFFREYAKKRLDDGEIIFFFLKSGEKRIAAQFTEIYAHRLWIYKIGYLEDWQFCSPGILLMNEVVKFGFIRGLKSCEFLGSNEPWLHIWANSIDMRLTCWIYPDSWMGKVGRVRDLSNEIWHNASNYAGEWFHR